ncbi:hypothetical protein V1520DRAFT_347551 [Lipomyces starkeyi]
MCLLVDRMLASLNILLVHFICVFLWFYLNGACAGLQSQCDVSSELSVKPVVIPEHWEWLPVNMIPVNKVEN